MRQWRYFSNDEIEGLHYDLVEKLDVARHLAGTSFEMTNTDGFSPSLSVSIEAKANHKRFTILHALMTVGFVRIGLSKTHIYVDMRRTEPQHVFWLESEN